MRFRTAALLGFALATIGLTSDAPAVERCSDHDPNRNVYWGDLHVHTAISMDAYMFDTRLRPDDAYRFATGGEVRVAPVGADGTGTRPLRIDRPLDFAAVTDHAHAFGGVRLCTDPNSAGYTSDVCKKYRSPFVVESLKQATNEIVSRVDSLRSVPLCGEDGTRCRAAAIDTWLETQQAAAKWNAAAPQCDFTTFVAYEYTATPDFTKIHRNVIFRNEVVPELPVTFHDEPTATGLWKSLRQQCHEAGTGCDAIAIPHNPNLSNGQLFTIEYPEGASRDEQIALAKQRAEMEPVVEMMQIKGDSECRNGMWNVLGSDELCGFEKYRDGQDVPDCKDGKGWGALAREGCISRRDFARNALVEGLMEQERIGVNPYAFGMIAATDVHDGTPGAVAEDLTDLQLGRMPQPGYGNGGLAAVWAEENTREALYTALKRREVYGTSGPRMQVRLFGGWAYPDDLCDDKALVAKGYTGGVPMGSDLPTRPKGGEAPTFVVSALRDPGTPERPGTPLQRAQIIKAWADDEGRIHQEVFDVAGGKNDAAVDTKTCKTRGEGADALCAVWSDPTFDDKRRAVYYARIVENPTCRTAGWICKELSGDTRFPTCDDPAVPKTTQERAWTSPIWYAP